MKEKHPDLPKKNFRAEVKNVYAEFTNFVVSNVSRVLTEEKQNELIDVVEKRDVSGVIRLVEESFKSDGDGYKKIEQSFKDLYLKER